MKAKELADLINGRFYDNEITAKEETIAKENNLVVVFGYSDELMEFRGAINGEIEGLAYIHNGKLLEDWCGCGKTDCDDCLSLAIGKKQSKVNNTIVEAIWDTEGYSFIYKTAIPHKTFDIMESEDDKDKYCRGIVFSLEDVQEMIKGG